MNTLDAIAARRSIRRLTGAPVPDEILEARPRRSLGEAMCEV
jgi:hypothetical protein